MPKSNPTRKPNPDLGSVAKKARWTIIVLMAAESDLQEEFKRVYDQMARVGSNPKEVNFVVIFDGLNLPGTNQGRIAVYNVLRNNFFQDKDNKGFVKRFPKKFDDLTDEKNLKKILVRVKNSFPASHYGFIYKGHGGPNPDINNARYIRVPAFRAFFKGKEESDGKVIKKIMNALPKIKVRAKNGKTKKVERELDVPNVIKLETPTVRGPKGPEVSNDETPIMVLFESTKGNSRELSYASMGQVLQEVFPSKGKNYGLDFVCLDSCWGQLIENGMAFKKVAKFLVASADEMAVMGIGYEGFCNFLVSRPDLFADELADLIVSEYFQTEYNDYLSDIEFNQMGVSLTCVETFYLDKVINLMCRLSDHLSQNMETHFYIIHLARLQCKAYTYELTESSYKMYNIDLIWFLENLQFYNRVGEKPIDEELDRLVSEILTQLSLYYIKSYLANNYEVRTPGGRKNGNGTHVLPRGKISKKKLQEEKMKSELGIKPIIGGKGIGIIFPSSMKQLRDSLYRDKKTGKWLDENWTWGSFLKAYAKKKDSIIRSGNSEAMILKGLRSFRQNAEYKTYLNRYIKLAKWINYGSGNGNGKGNGKKNENGNGDDLVRKKLLCAREGVKLNIEHKWVKEGALTSLLNKKLSETTTT